MADLKLVYIADPMCSWCWGFAAVLDELRGDPGPGLADATWELVMGGLAADSSEPMPEDVRAYVQNAWDAVERATGARFNREFWSRCAPRRSTYPACRAVLVAEGLRPGAGWSMFAALQRAYYLEARNPSLVETLGEVAAELVPALGVDAAGFGELVEGDAARRDLAADLARRRALGVRSFPSLVVERAGAAACAVRGYAPLAEARESLARALEGLPDGP